jgi:hypothetical protein
MGRLATGGGNGAINGWDVATLRDLIGGSTKLPDTRTVPKIKDKDANTNTEGIIKYLNLQRYYLQAQNLKNCSLSTNLPIMITWTCQGVKLTGENPHEKRNFVSTREPR